VFAVGRHAKSLKLLWVLPKAYQLSTDVNSPLTSKQRVEHAFEMRKQLPILMIGFMLIFALPGGANASTAWQLPLARPILVHQFLQPNSDYSAGHRGVDLLAKIGERVLAPADGIVQFTGVVVNRGVITLTHETLKTSFEPVCTTLLVGQRVLRGATIGRICSPVGYQNHCKPRICLHFSLRNSVGYLSPLYVIGGLSPSRLRPRMS